MVRERLQANEKKGGKEKKRSGVEQPSDRPEMRRELISGQTTNIVKLLVA